MTCPISKSLPAWVFFLCPSLHVGVPGVLSSVLHSPHFIDIPGRPGSHVPTTTRMLYWFPRVAINRGPHTRWLKTTGMWSLIVLEARSLKSSCQEGYAPSGTLDKILPFLFHLLAVAGNPQRPLACSCILPVSASIFTWPSPCVFTSSSLHVCLGPNVPL